MPYTLAISVGGSSATLATEKILMTLFWLMLMKPTVASIRKLILSNRNAVCESSESMSRKIWRASSNCSALSILERIMKLTARRVSITLRRMRPLKSSWRAMAPSASPAIASVTSPESTFLLTFSSSS